MFPGTLTNSERMTDLDDRGKTLMWRSVYFALGFLVARWLFKCQSEAIAVMPDFELDQVERLRAVGGM